MNNKLIKKEEIKHQNKFEDDLKVNIASIYESENKFESLIKNIDENPNLVEQLSEDKIDKLIVYYEKITREKEERIKRLKASLN